MLLPILPIRDTTSLFTLFFVSFVCALSGDFASDFFVGEVILSTLVSSIGRSTLVGVRMGKLRSLIESGDDVAAFVMLSSVALLISTGRLNLRVLRAEENLSN